MLPMILIAGAALALFIAYYSLLAKRGLTGLGFVSLFFLSFYAFATIVQFSKGRFDRPAGGLAKTFALYLLFLAAFVAVFIGGLMLGIPLRAFLSRFIGGYASTLGGVLYAFILVFMTALLREVNCRVASTGD